MTCPSIVCVQAVAVNLEITGIDTGIFVQNSNRLIMKKEAVNLAEPAKAFAFYKKRPTPEEEERTALMEGLSRTRTLIAQAYSCFNSTHDPDLIESYVFEINALQARYSYLLRRVKEMDGTPVRR